MGMKRRTFIHTAALGTVASLLWHCSDTRRIKLKKGLTIACLGDSITATEQGYVPMLQDYVDINHPGLQLNFLNWGKSGETVTGLTEEDHPGPRPYLFDRLDNLLNTAAVDIVIFCYGINCGIYGRPSSALFDSFTIGVHSFLEKIKQKGLETMLLTPPPLILDPVVAAEMDATAPFGYKNPYPKYQEEVLQKFHRIIMDIKHESVLGTVDIQTPLLEYHSSCYDQDPIHPNKNGHQLITNTIVANLTI